MRKTIIYEKYKATVEPNLNWFLILELDKS